MAFHFSGLSCPPTHLLVSGLGGEAMRRPFSCHPFFLAESPSAGPTDPTISVSISSRRALRFSPRGPYSFPLPLPAYHGLRRTSSPPIALADLAHKSDPPAPPEILKGGAI